MCLNVTKTFTLTFKICVLGLGIEHIITGSKLGFAFELHIHCNFMANVQLGLINVAQGKRKNKQIIRNVQNRRRAKFSS